MSRVQILVGDALTRLRDLPDQSVQMCVTSPPYWGLRNYAACACVPHRVQDESSTPVGSQAGTPNHAGKPMPDCPKCHGAGQDQAVAFAQLGLEATPEAYVGNLVEVFREVRRAMRDDGVVFLNLGDSYAGSNPGHGTVQMSAKQASNAGTVNPAADGTQMRMAKSGGAPPGLKPKDLVGIPWRVALALQADGWYLRSDIIWHKPNPMPESVTDRPTRSHEYIFLLTKSPRYYYDAAAVLEPFQGERWGGDDYQMDGNEEKQVKGLGRTRNCRPNPNGRNRRTVWTVSTTGYKGAHFATYPPALIEPCIKAGCPAGGVVLDPFGGAGTTGLVAARLGRDAILVELNPAYAEMARRRIEEAVGMLAAVTLEKETPC